MARTALAPAARRTLIVAAIAAGLAIAIAANGLRGIALLFAAIAAAAALTVLHYLLNLEETR